MDLELLNNLVNHAKEHPAVQNFIKELSQYLERTHLQEKERINTLKQENDLYQVVEMGTDGTYLQNVKNNQVSKEFDIPKELLAKIGNDTVLRYKEGAYQIEEELTQKFFDHLIGIKEYEMIQKKFIKESFIEKLDSNTIYKIQQKDEKNCLLQYGQEESKTMKVPNVLVPFWASVGENLYYKNGEFKRKENKE